MFSILESLSSFINEAKHKIDAAVLNMAKNCKYTGADLGGKCDLFWRAQGPGGRSPAV